MGQGCGCKKLQIEKSNMPTRAISNSSEIGLGVIKMKR